MSEAKRKLAESLSDTLIDYQKVQKWDGKLPTVASQSDFDRIKLNERAYIKYEISTIV